MAWYLTSGTDKVYGLLHVILLLDEDRSDRPFYDSEVQIEWGT